MHKAQAEVAGAQILGASYSVFIGFFLLVVILCIRPEGLLGKKFYAEVTVKTVGA